MTEGWIAYQGNLAESLAARYEALDPANLNAWFRDLLPSTASVILDVGAGSGRDAAWLASLGHEVVAVEPSADMRAEAMARHDCPRIRWMADSLPALDETYRLGLTFDVILLSAVWMHIAPDERQRAFRKLISLLRPGGLLVITLRHGLLDSDRVMYPVASQEVAALARAHALSVVIEQTSLDDLGRADVRWTHIALRFPDDGTGALPLLRHIILNDQKSATYKLGLLRSIARAADSAQGMARAQGDEFVSVPLGLIGLIWLRLYKPLLDASLPQSPKNIGIEGLGFAKEGYAGISSLSALDLRVGARFADMTASALHRAIGDAVSTIASMPAHFMTWPGSNNPIVRASRSGAGSPPHDLFIDERYLRSFGELLVPQHLWHALARYDAWIEPALNAEWSRLMHQYAERQGRVLDHGTVARALIWSEPSRGVGLVRRIALDTMSVKPLHCVWTGKRLSDATLDVDHCMPWSAWPCEDLWNLMPADSKVNRHQKRQRLPSAAALSSARDNILEWWDRAYVASGQARSLRFFAEAAASLPLGAIDGDLGSIFEGASVRRLSLRSDQRIEEWTPRV